MFSGITVTTRVRVRLSALTQP